MDAIGYRGIAFLSTGKAALLLADGRWLALRAAQAERLVAGRAEEGLPPIPAVDPPDVLPARDPLATRAGRRRHAPVALPPSVLAEPLAVWRGTGSASLTCERVIPYPGGFEIELRARGLLDEDAEMPWGRSSQGFWHLEGLRLTVAFGDGRSGRLDDLTAGDAGGPVTLSPFRRDDAALETFWLWVAPMPAGGPVRLAATWPRHGIAAASVAFDVAGP